MKFTRKKLPAFSLVELMVVMLVVAILASLIFTVAQKLRTQAYHTKAITNLKAVGMSALLYTSENEGYAPAVRLGNDTANNWPIVLAKGGYLNDPMVRQNANGNWVSDKSLVDLYNPITRSAYPDINNAGGYGLNGFRTIAKRTKITNFTYPAKTMLLADGNVNSNKIDIALSGLSWWSLYPSTLVDGGANYFFCDGHVEWIAAENPEDANSAPVGVNEDVLFLPN